MKNSKREQGFIAIDAAIGIGVLVILSSIVIALVLNIYNVMLSTHRTAVALNYAVEILENAKVLNYYDTQLNQGIYEGDNLLGVNLGENFDGSLDIKDYNKLFGNENKENLIKTLELTISYVDGNLNKNITISTLKINNNF